MLLTPSWCICSQEQGLDKDARLSDIRGKPQEQSEKHERVTDNRERVIEPPTKKQRVTAKHSPAAAGAGVSRSEKVSRGGFRPPHDRGPYFQ